MTRAYNIFSNVRLSHPQRGNNAALLDFQSIVRCHISSWSVSCEAALIVVCAFQVVFVLSGYVNPERKELRELGLALGADYRPDWTKDVIVRFSLVPILVTWCAVLTCCP